MLIFPWFSPCCLCLANIGPFWDLLQHDILRRKARCQGGAVQVLEDVAAFFWGERSTAKKHRNLWWLSMIYGDFIEFMVILWDIDGYSI